MRVLLDTSTLLWQLGLEKNKLGQGAINMISEVDTVYVSSISLIEMHIKTMHGKLNVPAEGERMVLDAGLELLAFSAEAADGLRNFPELARHDPFDRMLLAQAKEENLIFLTADRLLLGLGLDFVVDATL